MRARLLTVALIGAVAFVQPAAASETVIKISVEKEAPEKKTKPGKAPFTGKRPAVDLAILLDTSNSMDGLISQAKAQLWKIVNRFADAKKDGKTPVLRVALFEYGNTSLPASEGYLRQVVPLTDDLDKISEQLFALKTNGGDEYCGQVIDQALSRLDWSKEPGSYQSIFIAGNEPFTQGSVDYRKSCQRAIELGVVVNTIHCGSYSNGVSGQWAHGAELAEGEYLNIDQDRAVERIATPHDKIIIKLSSELNSTYLWYGAKAEHYRSNQAEQDRNATRLSSSIAASRAATKASSNYSNFGRCVVDNFIADEKTLDKIAEKDLPEVLRDLSPEQRVAHVKQLAAQRKDLQQQIKQLNRKRDLFAAQARKKNAKADAEATLGDAFAAAIDQQIKLSGFETNDR